MVRQADIIPDRLPDQQYQKSRTYTLLDKTESAKFQRRVLIHLAKIFADPPVVKQGSQSLEMTSKEEMKALSLRQNYPSLFSILHEEDTNLISFSLILAVSTDTLLAIEVDSVHRIHIAVIDSETNTYVARYKTDQMFHPK